MKETKKVIITSCNFDTYWYKPYIGKEFNVEEAGKYSYRVTNEDVDKYELAKSGVTDCFIDKCDCKIILKNIPIYFKRKVVDFIHNSFNHYVIKGATYYYTPLVYKSVNVDGTEIFVELRPKDLPEEVLNHIEKEWNDGLDKKERNPFQDIADYFEKEGLKIQELRDDKGQPYDQYFFKYVCSHDPYKEEPKQSIKPPLGILPFEIHNRERFNAINDAIERYRIAGKEIPKEWIGEKESLEAYLNGLKKEEYESPYSCYTWYYNKVFGVKKTKHEEGFCVYVGSATNSHMVLFSQPEIVVDKYIQDHLARYESKEESKQFNMPPATEYRLVKRWQSNHFKTYSVQVKRENNWLDVPNLKDAGILKSFSQEYLSDYIKHEYGSLLKGDTISVFE